MDKIAVLIPCFNEGKTIEKLVRYVLIVFYGFPLFPGLAGVGDSEQGDVLKNRFTEENREQ